MTIALIFFAPDMPPLPEPFVPLYGDERHKWEDQMRAYATTAVLAEQKKWEQVGYVMRTGHGTQFAGTLEPHHLSLMWVGRPMWTPMFIRAEPKPKEQQP